MPGIRVLVANEPRAYRDTLASLVRAHRPTVDVIVAEPTGIDDALVAHDPHLVFCSRVTELLLTKAPAWIVLYPNGAGLVVASIAGHQHTATDLDTTHLLALVDETAQFTIDAGSFA
ncbi:MAG TPA: hypothetical protein VH482_14360 [Thermomicrobiales bacterium]|jgi:hypothetical protein